VKQGEQSLLLIHKDGNIQMRIAAKKMKDSVAYSIATGGPTVVVLVIGNATGIMVVG
jgi:hypothetical protein